MATDEILENANDPVVLFLRLKTGEDLISEVVESEYKDRIQYWLIEPMKIVYIPGKVPGSVILTMIDWVFPKITEVREFAIHQDDVLLSCAPSDALIEYYYDTIRKNPVVVDRFPDASAADGTEITDEHMEYIKNFFENAKIDKKDLN